MLSFLVIKTEFLIKSLNPVARFARSQFPACFLFWRRFVDIVIGGLMLVSRGYWMAVEVLDGVNRLYPLQKNILPIGPSITYDMILQDSIPPSQKCFISSPNLMMETLSK